MAFRRNMWVMTDEGIGIIYALSEVCEIHLVDKDDGTTRMSVYKNINDLRQAKYLEIPEIRRGSSKEWFNKKGYM